MGGYSPPGSPAMFNRRHFLAGATLAGLAAPAILRAEGGIFREFPFSLGVAAGDPASAGFVIWKRLDAEPMERHGGLDRMSVVMEKSECGRVDLAGRSIIKTTNPTGQKH